MLPLPVLRLWAKGWAMADHLWNTRAGWEHDEQAA